MQQHRITFWNGLRLRQTAAGERKFSLKYHNSFARALLHWRYCSPPHTKTLENKSKMVAYYLSVTNIGDEDLFTNIQKKKKLPFGDFFIHQKESVHTRQLLNSVCAGAICQTGLTRLVVIFSYTFPSIPGRGCKPLLYYDVIRIFYLQKDKLPVPTFLLSRSFKLLVGWVQNRLIPNPCLKTHHKLKVQWINSSSERRAYI